MKATPRIAAALTAGAAMALGSLPATAAAAESVRVNDRVGDASSSAVDVTALEVRRREDRIRAVLSIPELEPGRLSGTEILIRATGESTVYAVVVLRDRSGRVVKTALSRRPLNDPVEPEPLSCKGITTSLSAERAAVSVPTSCLAGTGADEGVRVKARTVDGTTGLENTYFNDQTRFAPVL